MKSSSEVFVKLNCKSISESRSLIIDRECSYGRKENKYLMCAGKYDKNGWTIVFKAKDFKEAEEIVNNNPFMNNKGYSANIM
ncbi:MAG: hypothetical protein ACRC28_08130 [Clostridium sp.]|uniref:hypothetical protein n=1 Tax=Clostridium sp. TaxID=1506 RepID=UPI003F3612A8